MPPIVRASPSIRPGFAVFALLLTGARAASAAGPTAGFPEAVVQWGVQKGETCDDVAKALYGSPKYAPLVQRYNHVACGRAPLPEGLTLVLPSMPTTLPDAKMRSMNPDVRARPPGGGWNLAAPGMPLYSNYNVNTLDQGRADVEFIDRTRVFLAPNTLIVIYGTANQTRVSKTAPVAVEVEQGEVKAGLQALRGESVDIGIKGGGRIDAASRDTVIQRKGDRTTVAVFDGKAGVSAGGKTVEVPKNFGTRFVGQAPPAPPRPLPPAPRWAAGGTGPVALSAGGQGKVTLSWVAEPVAVSYRVEVARDEGFHDLVLREEAPKSVTSFRAEKLPIGTYYVAVRAIDKDEYLGIASEKRAVRIVDANLEGGAVNEEGIEANPYGVLRFQPAPDVEMALDDGPFGPVLDTLDLTQRPARVVRMRRRGDGAAADIAIHYTKITTDVSTSKEPDGASLRLRVKLAGLDGIDVAGRVKPSARVHANEGIRAVALSAGPAGELTGVTPLLGVAAGARIDIVDARGVVIGSGAAAADEPVIVAPARYPVLGSYAPLWPASPSVDVLPFAPTAPDEAVASAAMVRSGGAWGVAGEARASGSIGPVSAEAALRSSASNTDGASATAWLGARFRALRIGTSQLELAPAFRVGLPASASGAPVQLEPGLALGGAAGRFTWLVDLGGRARLADDGGKSGAPKGQGFLLGGATFEPIRWLRLAASLDAHLTARDVDGLGFLGGLGLGVEAGGPIFGGVSLRLSPWNDPGYGAFMGQLAFGVRGFP